MPCMPLVQDMMCPMQANVHSLCEEMRVVISPILARPVSRAPAEKGGNPAKKGEWIWTHPGGVQSMRPPNSNK